MQRLQFLCQKCEARFSSYVISEVDRSAETDKGKEAEKLGAIIKDKIRSEFFVSFSQPVAPDFDYSLLFREGLAEFGAERRMKWEADGIGGRILVNNLPQKCLKLDRLLDDSRQLG
jgi:hypothetical protein